MATSVLEKASTVPPPVREETQQETAFCCRCKEDFPVAQEPASWTMGLMRLLARAPKFIQDQFREWLTHPGGKYLCGNC